jgi:hypothetical protein
MTIVLTGVFAVAITLARMSGMLSRMMMLSEGYPELKASGQLLHLQRTLQQET